ncbi:hypothetical protein LINPERPRIM_LOCUS28908 [Linum perenne]
MCAIHLLTDVNDREHQHAVILLRNSSDFWKETGECILSKANHLVDALANMGHNLGFGTHTINTSDDLVKYWLMYDNVGGMGRR